MYLVVRVFKCKGLAIANLEGGASDPFVIVEWDNMTRRTATMSDTVRPVFNHDFYFPVWFFNPALLDRKYHQNALMNELEMKGQSRSRFGTRTRHPFRIFFFILPLADALNTRFKEKMSLLDADKPFRDLEDEFLQETVRKKKRWYQREVSTRHYAGDRTQLRAPRAFANSNIATINFEAYFHSDLPDAVNPAKSDADAVSAEKYMKKKIQFDRERTEFAQRYSEPFPQSLVAKKAKKDFPLTAMLCASFHALGGTPVHTYALFPC